MKKRIYIMVGLLMVGIIAYRAISISGVLEALSNKTATMSSTASETSTQIDTSNLTEFEINAMESARVEEIAYKGDTTNSCGYAIKIQSYSVLKEGSEISEIEGFSDYFKEYYGEGKDKALLIVDIEIKNESVEEFFKKLFEGGVKAQLCLGNIWAETFDDKGNRIDSKQLFSCSNDRTSIRAKNAWMYPLEKDEKYTGKLVYVFDKEDIKNVKIGVAVGLMSNNKDTTGSKLIMLN